MAGMGSIVAATSGHVGTTTTSMGGTTMATAVTAASPLGQETRAAGVEQRTASAPIGGVVVVNPHLA